MPLPTLFFLVIGIGIAAALASKDALRMSVRPVLLSGSFATFLGFLLLVAIPISAYFYVFYGDWFLLYLSDVRKIPSALALLGFVLEGLVGVLGFVLGASLMRRQVVIGYWLIGSCIALSVLVFGVFHSRVWKVGNYTQFHYGFALKSYASSGMLLSGLLMTAILGAATTYLIFRLKYGERGHR